MKTISDILESEFKVKTQQETLDNVLRIKNRFSFDFDVYLPSIGENLQRELVWDEERKNEFILSIFKGIKIMPVSILKSQSEDGKVVYRVIDGKQRINALLDFLANKFKFKFRGIEMFYDELEAKDKYKISSFRFDSLVGYEYWDDKISDEDLIKWFDMLNFSGTAQDSKHIQNLKNKLKTKI